MVLGNLFHPKPSKTSDHLLASQPLPQYRAPRRIKIFNLVDVLFVSDPDEIRHLESSQAITRLHSEETRDIPAIVRFALQASMWFNPETDAWFMGMEAKDSQRHPINRDMRYHKRIAYIRNRLKSGYGKRDIKDMVKLLHDGDKHNVQKKALNMVIGRFLKEDANEVPDDIVTNTNLTITKPAQLFNVPDYIKARRANLSIIRWLQKSLHPDANLGDTAHNVHVTTKGFSRLLLEYTDKSNKFFKSPKQYLTKNPAVAQLFRVAAKDSKLENELSKPLDKPLVPYKSIVVLDIAQATKDTGDDLFAFGGGIEDRQCPFKKFFYEFLTDAKRKV